MRAVSQTMNVLHKASRSSAGYWSIVSAGLSIGSLLDFGTRFGVAGRWFALIPAIALYAVMFASGILILKGRWLGVWLLFLTQLPQLPVVSTGSIAYALMPAPSLELYIFPIFGFHFSTWGQFTLEWNAADLPFQASVSGGAVILFAWAVNALGGYPSKATAG